MSTLEDRIRAATRAAGGTVRPGSVPQLRLITEPGPRHGARPPLAGWSRWSRRLAPLAAAAAVIAVVAVLVAVRGAVRTEHGGITPGGPGKPAPGPSVTQYVASGAVPRYYVSIESRGNPNFHPSYAVVRATATGAALGTINSSLPGGTVLAVSGAGDDRTFVLDEGKWVPSDSTVNASWETRSFYLVRLGSTGQPASVTKLPVTAGKLVTGVALSPDAAKLAIAVQPQDDAKQPNLSEIRVYTLATGAERVWRGNGTIGGAADDAASVSWAAGGRYLAFNWSTGNFTSTHDGTLLLDTTRGGSDLVSDSRPVISRTIAPPNPPGTRLPTSAGAFVLPTTPASSPPPGLRALTCGAGTVTPDGSAVVCGAIATYDETMTKKGLVRNAETAFVEYSTATRKITRVLGHWTFDDVGGLAASVLWSNPSGTVLIGTIPDSGDGKAGIISGNEFTPLPGPALNGVW